MTADFQALDRGLSARFTADFRPRLCPLLLGFGVFGADFADHSESEVTLISLNQTTDSSSWFWMPMYPLSGRGPRRGS